jgi:hypothetical protein
MTVAIPENGLRLSGSADAGRVFEFTLMAIESGLKFLRLPAAVRQENRSHKLPEAGQHHRIQYHRTD